MHYQESNDRAAEFVRQALPLMSRHQIPASPDHYTVWYEYVSGRNQALKTAIDEVLARHQQLSAEFSKQLYDRYFLDQEARIAEQMRLEVQQMVGAVLEQLGHSGQQADHYGKVLADYHSRLHGKLDNAQFRQLLGEFMAETRAMQQANRELQARLDRTTSELDQLRQELEQARQAATVDSLTGIANRQAFDEALAEAMAQATADDQHLCLIMADIDNFKHFNDSHGHLTGDKLLRVIAGLLSEGIKGQDLVARFGGEEFAILLPNTPLRGGLTVAEHLRATVQQQRLRKKDTQEPLGSVTLSMGVALYRPGESAHSFIGRADAALYHSKRFGRNRVTIETQVPAA
ncbi:GGDEF domain-containing protein [Thiohalobacter sp. IOR34]|uniref:GGDEF domain-containing protein n=1 Tax=Thiohalobacter sp. IOR34 TaxID=3057176 RepID=UPI0025B1C902|nr:GGDEF domain-containing protein [Thiohalobacter sp. IOR34]WJW75615.1 GGDEF domain-containing protein [Thiohalobacter sp. IOR34]